VLKPRERIQEFASLRPYFHKVCGFYVIEATVYQTANNLMPRSQVFWLRFVYKHVKVG
jgi:hypothetical protein